MRFWFKRGNNRNYRREVFNLEMRSEFSRADKGRFVTLFVGGSFGILILCIVVWQFATFFKTRFITKNPAYAIKVIDVETDGVISREQIWRWSGVQVGQNLIDLDISHVRRNLELIPMIRDVSVEKVLPATLRIRVTEREPIAKVLMTDAPGSETFYTVDEMGFVMLPLHFSQLSTPVLTNGFLPTIIGIGRTDLKIGTRVNSQQVLSALRLLSSFERSQMAGLVNINVIDVSYPGILQVITDQGSRITFGTEQHETQLRRWRTVYDYGRKMGKMVVTLDLSVANNVPATWADISNMPPGQIYNKQLKTTRKRNV